LIYLKAFENEITRLEKYFNIFVIIFGIVCGGISFAMTARALYFAIVGGSLNLTINKNLL
jgi:hypothetical protein